MSYTNMESDIVYIFTIKPECEDLFDKTTCKHSFAGVIETDLRHGFVVKLCGVSNAYVIVPKNAIQSMAPSKVYWDMHQQQTTLASLRDRVPEKYMF